MTSARRELALSVCLVGIAVVASVWLGDAMAVVDEKLVVRETQLQHLAGLRHRAASDGLPDDIDLRAFAGLFAGFELSAVSSPTGPCLVLREARPGKR